MSLKLVLVTALIHSCIRSISAPTVGNPFFDISRADPTFLDLLICAIPSISPRPSALSITVLSTFRDLRI
jgi:hypothetical protein